MGLQKSVPCREMSVTHIEVLFIMAYFASEICSSLLGDSVIDPKVRQEAIVGRSPKNILENMNFIC